jgi:hypothetical protein
MKQNKTFDQNVTLNIGITKLTYNTMQQNEKNIFWNYITYKFIQHLNPCGTSYD